MKNRILCALAAGITAVCSAICLAAPACAERQYENCISNVGVYDLQGDMDEANLAVANQTVQETSANIDMYVAVYICGDETEFAGDYAMEQFADDQYDELFNPQYGVDTDGVLMVVSYDLRYVYISTSGMGQLYYYNGSSDDRIDSMISNLTSALQAKDDLGAVVRFCQDLEYYYDLGVPDDAYTYNSDNGEYIYYANGSLKTSESLPWWYGINWSILLPAGAVLGIIAALIAVFSVKHRYQLKKSLAPINYVSQQETNFYVQEDLFLRKHVSKTHISSDSRSGGGGGGGGFSHTSSGGHSHGGGGGHF